MSPAPYRLIRFRQAITLCLPVAMAVATLLFRTSPVRSADDPPIIELGKTGGPVSTFKFIEGGSRLLSATGGSAVIWDVAKRKPLTTVRTGTSTTSIADDGSTLLTHDGVLWDGRSGQRKGALNPGAGILTAAQLSGDAKTIVALHKPQKLPRLGPNGKAMELPPTELVVYDAQSKKPKYRIPPPSDQDPIIKGWPWPTVNVSFSPDDKTIAAHHLAGGVYFFDSSNGRQTAKLEQFGPLYSSATNAWVPLVWLSDSRHVVNIGTAVVRWDVSLQKAISMTTTGAAAADRSLRRGFIPIPQGPVSDEVPVAGRLPQTLSARCGACVSGDGRRLAFYVDKYEGRPKEQKRVRSGELVLCDLEKGAVTATLPVEGDDIVGLAFSPDLKSLAMGYEAGTVKLLNLSKIADVVGAGGDRNGDFVSNPEFESWADCKVGTKVERLIKTTTDGKTWIGKIETTLGRRDAEQLISEAVSTYTNQGNGAAKRIGSTVPSRVLADDVYKADGFQGTCKRTGKQTVSVGQTKYECIVLQLEGTLNGHKYSEKKWICPDVPGLTVKSQAVETGLSTMKHECTLNTIDKR